MPKKHILTAAKIVISAALLFWILRSLEPAAVLHHVAEADFILLAGSFAMFFIGYFITALRWRMLLKAQEISASLGFLIRSFMVGIFFNNLLPSTIGGDAVRMYDTWRLGNSKSGAASVVLIDRLMGLLALAVYSLATIFFTGELVRSVTILPWLVLGAVAGLAAITWIIFLAPPRFLSWFQTRSETLSPSVGQLSRKVTSAISAFNGKNSLLLRAFGLSLLLQLNVILHFTIVAAALNIDVPIIAMFTVIPLSILVMMLPITINGIGLREGVFVFFLGAYGVDAIEAVAFAWVALGFIILQGALGGIVFAFRGESRVYGRR